MHILLMYFCVCNYAASTVLYWSADRLGYPKVFQFINSPLLGMGLRMRLQIGYCIWYFCEIVLT